VQIARFVDSFCNFFAQGSRRTTQRHGDSPRQRHRDPTTVDHASSSHYIRRSVSKPVAVIARSICDAAIPTIVRTFQEFAAHALGLDPRVAIAPRNDNSRRVAVPASIMRTAAATLHRLTLTRFSVALCILTRPPC
jgi:hypothetical protein